MKSFAACFADLPDPRAHNALHDLTDLMFIALLATLCGATSCTDMALFARTKAYLLKPILGLEHGLPSHDTFSRVFRMLDPRGFEKSFQKFMKAFAEAANIKRPKGVVAVDGKALRRGYESGKSHMPPVMVTVWAAQTRMALANTLAPGNNEAAGALQLIELLQLKGCIVTADALHCHRAMAKAITERGGDYVLAVKDNQPALRAEAEAAIAAAIGKGARPLATVDADHGRLEIRQHWVTEAIEWLPSVTGKPLWPGLRSIGMIQTQRRSGEQNTSCVRFYLSSLPADAGALVWWSC